jgi:AAA15 family ATPase/GTPase
MLIEFSVGNYRSFHGIVTLGMVAAKLKAKYEAVDADNAFQVTDSIKLLKSAAIYGANASGKSNLIRAMAFMSSFVVHSATRSQAEDPIRVEPFRLSTETRGAPSYFQMIFYLDGKRYRYGYEVDGKRVHSEWLYHARERETRLFIREGDEFDLSSVFREGRGLTEKTRDNALFLSVVAQFNGPIARKIIGWFGHLGIMSGLGDLGYRLFTMRRLENSDTRDPIVQLVRRLDVDIVDLQIEDAEQTVKYVGLGVPPPEAEVLARRLQSQLSGLGPETVKSKRLTTYHRKFNEHHEPVGLEAFDLDLHESDGTQKLVALVGPFLDALANGGILVIDELDARLHPQMTCFLIRQFNSRVTNPKNAQLIFATHDTSLLRNDIFRRDQVWFTEKNRYGATDLYSLAEYRVRNDASYGKDYIAGKFGAIPYLGSLEDLVSDVDG